MQSIEKAKPLWTWFAYLGGLILAVLLVIVASAIYGLRTKFTNVSDKHPQQIGREMQWKRAMVLKDVPDIGDCISLADDKGDGKTIGSVPSGTRFRIRTIFDVQKFANASHTYAEIRILEGPHSGEDFYVESSLIPGLENASGSPTSRCSNEYASEPVTAERNKCNASAFH